MTGSRLSDVLHRKRRTTCTAPAAVGVGWGCPWCRFPGLAPDAVAAASALAEHQREHCPGRKVRVWSLGPYWGWTHQGCESAMHVKWTWPDALQAAWWHVASHDLSLTDEESAELVCRARRAVGDLW